MIDIQNLSKRYFIRGKDYTWRQGLSEIVGLKEKNFHQALSDVTVEIKQGEVFGILGPNGAGKTTMLKIIAGFLLPEQGHITVNGYDIIKNRKEVRLSVNFLRSGGWVIFDYKYALDELLRFWGIFMGLRKEEATAHIDEVLSVVGLLEKKKDFPENLSSGMLQRLNLARCLMCPRPVYLLDEPTVNIDPYSADLIRQYVKKNLTKNGTTAVLATNNIWEAEMICDRIAILNRGRIIKIDTPAGLKKKIGKQALHIQINTSSLPLQQELQALPYISEVTSSEGTLLISGDDLKTKIIDITDICRKYGTISSVDITEPSLNEIFLKIIKEANT